MKKSLAIFGALACILCAIANIPAWGKEALFLDEKCGFDEGTISPSLFEGVKLVHMEGRCLLNSLFIEKTMHMAHSAGIKISFDLTKTEHIDAYRERIWALIETYADVLFAHQEEAYALTSLNPEQAAQFLTHLCPLVIVSTSEGCWVSSSDEGMFYAPPFSERETKNTEKEFTTAFLYAYLHGCSLKECVNCGNLADRK